MKCLFRNMILSLAVLTGLLAVSCRRSDEPGQQTQAKIVLSTISRAMLDGTEGDPDYAITSLRVMIFHHNGLLAYNRIIDLSQGNPFTIEMTTGTFDFVFIANEDSDTQVRPNGKTLTQVLDNYAGRTLSDICNEYFCSSAFRNDYAIPMTALYRNVTVKDDNTVTLSGESSPEPRPWLVPTVHAGIRVDLTLKTEKTDVAQNFSGLKITSVPSRVYLFSTDANGQPIYNGGAYEPTSPLDAWRSFAGDQGDLYAVDAQHNETFTHTASPVEFEPDPDHPGIYVWHKRLILPSTMFIPASDESKGILLHAMVYNRPCSATLGTAELGYTVERNSYYRLIGTVKTDTPIEFQVNVIPWGQNTYVPLP